MGMKTRLDPTELLHFLYFARWPFSYWDNWKKKLPENWNTNSNGGRLATWRIPTKVKNCQHWRVISTYTFVILIHTVILLPWIDCVPSYTQYHRCQWRQTPNRHLPDHRERPEHKCVSVDCFSSIVVYSCSCVQSRLFVASTAVHPVPLHHSLYNLLLL